MAKLQEDYYQDRVEQKRQIFPSFVNRYLDYYEGNISYSSLDGYLDDYKIFFQWMIQEGLTEAKNIKDIPLLSLERLDPEDIMNFVKFLGLRKSIPGTDKKKDGNRKPTINRKLSALKALFKYLHTLAENKEDRTPLLGRNVMLKVAIKTEKVNAKVRAEKIEGKILHTNELDHFRDFVRDGYGRLEGLSKKAKEAHQKNWERDTAIISLILGSGLRVGEVASLTIDKVNLVDASVRVIRKGGQEHEKVISFSEQAKNDLEVYLAIRDSRYNTPANEKALFVTKYGSPYGKAFIKRSMQAIVGKYAQAYQKPEMTIHKLRHSFATAFHEKVNDVPMLMEQLGHANSETTMIYTHINRNRIKEALKKMES
jgi:site-specific recombinase XerD